MEKNKDGFMPDPFLDDPFGDDPTGIGGNHEDPLDAGSGGLFGQGDPFGIGGPGPGAQPEPPPDDPLRELSVLMRPHRRTMEEIEDDELDPEDRWLYDMLSALEESIIGKVEKVSPEPGVMEDALSEEGEPAGPGESVLGSPFRTEPPMPGETQGTNRLMEMAIRKSMPRSSSIPEPDGSALKKGFPKGRSVVGYATIDCPEAMATIPFRECEECRYKNHEWAENPDQDPCLHPEYRAYQDELFERRAREYEERYGAGTEDDSGDAG